MFSFNLFLSWHFLQDEDDYSTTIMHPSRNSYTAPAALLNEIAHTAEHVCIYCTFYNIMLVYVVSSRQGTVVL